VVNVALSVSTNQFLYNGLKTGAAILEANLTNKQLQLALKSDAVSGGAAQVSISLNASQNPATFASTFNFNKVDAHDVWSALFGFKFASGPASFEGDISSLGNSDAEMISNLSGWVNGRLEGATVAGTAIANFTHASGAGWPAGNSAALYAQAKFTLQQGVASVSEGKISGAGFAWPIAGEIDLLRKALNITAVGQWRLSGPWVLPAFQ
jgi:AsmA-like C-terminal region